MSSPSADLRQRGQAPPTPDDGNSVQIEIGPSEHQQLLRNRMASLLPKQDIAYSSLNLNMDDPVPTPAKTPLPKTPSARNVMQPSAGVNVNLADLLLHVTRPMEKVAFEVKGALLATGFASTCYLLNWFKVVLIPFFLAIFLMYLVDPLVEMIDVSPKYFCCVCTSRGRHARRRSRGCSRAFSSLCAVSVVCLFFFLLGYIAVLSIHALEVTKYQEGYTAFVQHVEVLSQQVGVPMNITTTLHDNVDKLARLVLTEAMDLLSTLFVTMIYLTYFLCTRTRASDAGGVWSKIDMDIQRFVTLKCYLSLLVALLVTIVYVSLNVGLAIFWGILTFILNWIPNVGAMIASFLPLLIIMISPEGPHGLMSPMDKFLAVVLPMCFHMFVGNFIEPKVFGRKLEMDPVVVIISLSAWGLLWGVVGMMLSVPLTAAFKIMCSHLKLWPELVALMDGTYFVRSAEKKQEEKTYKAREYAADDDHEGM
ncbi:transmembrane protein [Achlya hypogyna]|uniref:Transmembrane protein n=1 Tax=Achlya hypogyna TaxID=1202772 RepID=A0A1V9YD26_ACHHY|nr:transmembrane protein [Achlya hypogyna]